MSIHTCSRPPSLSLRLYLIIWQLTQPGSEPVIRHIQFDENGEEVTESQPVPTAEELQQESVDDAEQVCVGSAKKRRKKKRSSSKGRKISDL